MTLLTVNPFDNVGLSALVAAVPIILFLLCLTVFKIERHLCSIDNFGCYIDCGFICI